MTTYYSNLRKAWEVVGNFDDKGDLFCVECSLAHPDKTKLTGGAVFVSDLGEGELTCDKCHERIK